MSKPSALPVEAFTAPAAALAIAVDAVTGVVLSVVGAMGSFGVSGVVLGTVGCVSFF